jgi:RNA polymerase sigma-70 factor (ECF subfamily)
MVLAAADCQAGTSSRRALEELIQAYWFPLYAFIRRQGNSPQQSEDLTQGFFAHLLEKEGLTRVDRSKGKFRSFLLAAFQHFAADQGDKARAQKRGGGRQAFSLDTDNAEALYARQLSDTMTPERQFERSWALSLLDQVLRRLEQEYQDAGKGAAFAAMRHTLDGQGEAQSYQEQARRLGMSEGALRVFAHRMRRRYRELLREEIMQTVSSPELVDEEILYLLQCL